MENCHLGMWLLFFLVAAEKCSETGAQRVLAGCTKMG